MTIRTARSTGLVVGLAVILLSAGCSSSYSDKYPGAPSQGDVRGTISDEAAGYDDIHAPTLYWSGTGHELLLTTWGSGSCPSEPVHVDATSGNALDIELKSGGGVCTGDYEASTYTLALPEGIDAGSDVELWINGTYVLTLSAFG